MNFGMIDVVVDSHIRDIRRQAGPPRTGARRGVWPLRSRIGFALVEAGLYLQATAARPAVNGRMRLNERSY